MKFCKTLCVFLTLCILCGCGASLGETESSVIKSAGESWTVGFGTAEIYLPAGSAGPLYIAGFNNGVEISNVLDTPRASAVWLETGGTGVLLISVDCIALSSTAVGEIRAALAEFCKTSGCASVNVIATHTHAGIDTLGLWGPEGVDGKNDSYMENLIDAACRAAEEAYAARTAGSLYYGVSETEFLQFDSRNPSVIDPNLYQLRFAPAAAAGSLRILTYGAHAESLRDDNTKLSRDYPGVLTDSVKAQTGADAIYFPGAIGGQIVTRDLCTGLFDAEENLRRTGELLAQASVEIRETEEQPLTPTLGIARVEFDIPLDNPLYMFYQTLGVLDYPMQDGSGATGYTVRAEVTAITLGEATLLLLPGEIFPELVTGEGLTSDDPAALAAIAAASGRENLIVIGLANGELGYIIPPHDYVLDEKLPYIASPAGDEDHYEETNSVGISAAAAIADAVNAALEMLK